MASDDGNMACCGQRNASDGDMPIAMAKPKVDDECIYISTSPAHPKELGSP